jgi:GMP synthase (glutamine-hydrolysing)
MGAGGGATSPFLILQLRPEDETADAEFDALLRYGGLSPGEVERVRLERVDPFPEIDPSAWAGIIVGGSPFDITTPADRKGPTQRRIEAGFSRLFSRLVPADAPFLGCCSGNGLLGSWLGGSLSRRYAEPVSAASIELTEAARSDPLTTGMPERIRVLLGHKEACDDVPPGAVLLARSDACPVQMFRVGRNVYATQFHPEGDPEGFAVRIRIYRDHGYFPAESADALMEKLAPEETPWAQEILRRFVERYRR